MVCTGCPSRFVLDQENETCEECPDHCTYCNKEKECYSCDAGYQLKEKKCEKVDVPNCEIPSHDTGCASCKPHFYLIGKENKCEKCHSSCLMCEGPNDDDCTSCSVSKFALRIPDENPFLSFFGASKLKCVDSCPKEYNGKSYQLHELSRECVAQTEIETRPKSTYAFVRHQAIKNWEIIYDDSVAFHQDYLKHAKHSIENAKNWANLHPKEASKYSGQCNYRGELIEKISASREAYYHCECIHEMHGPNCEVDKELYAAIQTHVMGVSKDLLDLKSSMSEDLLPRQCSTSAKLLCRWIQSPI